MDTSAQSSQSTRTEQLRKKIGWLCQLIRWLMVVYLLWVTYFVLSPVVLQSASQTAAEWAKYWGMEEGSIAPANVYFNRAIVLISTASVGLLCYAVWKLMGSYMVGDIFSAQAARRFRFLGLVALFSALIDVVVRPFALGVLSMDIFPRAPFQEWFNAVDLMYLLIALFVFALGHIQSTAASIAEEHQQFV